MVKRNDRLSGIQYSSLVASTIIGVTVISLPKIATTSAQEGAMVSTLICGLLTGLFAVSMAILGERFLNQTVMEYSPLILGKIFGKLLGIILIAYFITSTGVILRNFSDALKGLLLKNTPLEVIMISMLLTSTYLTLNGIRGIAKLSELFLPIIILSLLLVIFLNVSNFNFVRVRPMLFPDPMATLKGVPDLTSAFLGYEIILLATPFLRRDKKAVPYAIAGMGIPIILYTLLIIMAVGGFGLKTTQQLNYPTITLAEGINFPGAFAERFDIFFVILWILAAFTSIANLFYMSSLATVRLFNLRNYQPFTFLLVPFVYILAILPQNLMEIRRVSLYVGYLGIAISVVIAGMLFFAWIFDIEEKADV